jgi:hypothetical protein
MSDIYIRWGAVDMIDDATGRPYKEPAMGVTRTMHGHRAPIFAIPLSSAWAYAEPDYLMEASFKIASFLGMFPDQFLINRIADLISNYLPDLIKAKPIGDEKGVAYGEGKLMIEGEEVERFEVYTGGGIAK